MTAAGDIGRRLRCKTTQNGRSVFILCVLCGDHITTSSTHRTLFPVFAKPPPERRHLRPAMTGPVPNAVRLFGYANQNGFDASQFQRLVVLLGLRHRRAPVLFAGHDQRRGRHIFHDRQQRPTLVVLDVVPGRPREPVLGRIGGDVRGQVEAVPVDDRIECEWPEY